MTITQTAVTHSFNNKQVSSKQTVEKEASKYRTWVIKQNKESAAIMFPHQNRKEIIDKMNYLQSFQLKTGNGLLGGGWLCHYYSLYQLCIYTQTSQCSQPKDGSGEETLYHQQNFFFNILSYLMRKEIVSKSFQHFSINQIISLKNY